MTARQLLRLYPRGWRDRYGDEFLELAGSGSLPLQQVVDVVAGAIDAWFSSDVHGTTGAAAGAGGTHMLNALMACDRNQKRYTRRDSMIGAAVIIGVSLLLT